MSILVYSRGDKAEDILESFGLSEGDAKKYDTVKARFEDYFVEKKNPIFERAKFITNEGKASKRLLTIL